jgi:hypothetical protein
MSHSRHHRNSSEDTAGGLTACCATLFAISEESEARNAHHRGDHQAEARSWENAAQYQHLAGNHHAEADDERRAEEARGTCVLL